MSEGFCRVCRKAARRGVNLVVRPNAGLSGPPLRHDVHRRPQEGRAPSGFGPIRRQRRDLGLPRFPVPRLRERVLDPSIGSSKILTKPTGLHGTCTPRPGGVGSLPCPGRSILRNAHRTLHPAHRVPQGFARASRCFRRKCPGLRLVTSLSVLEAAENVLCPGRTFSLPSTAKSSKTLLRF